METIRGRKSLELDFSELTDRLANYDRIILDLGTGDGKFVHHLAESFPHNFIIGVDSCRENLHERSRVKLPNMLFLIASAQDLPRELNGHVSHITINFPWGSLLESLLIGDPNLMCGLASISQANATIDIRLNGGALSEAGTDLETGAVQICDKMRESGWLVKNPRLMTRSDLQNFPTSWAKRLAYGRDPRAMALSGHLAQ